MPTFFSVSLLTIVVVAGIATVGWVRRRSIQSKDASNKKTDKEVMTDSDIEIVVANDKQNLAKSTPPSDQVDNQRTQSLSSFGASLSNKISLEYLNRRQYVKTVRDRFESWSSGSIVVDSSENESGDAKPVATDSQEAPSAGNVTTAFRTKPKPNNLSSFVRQCVSNIERSTSYSPMHKSNSRNSLKSNQCESPPKLRMREERRVPGLVTATDCDSRTSPTTCDEVDDEFPLQDEMVVKRALRRVPSDHATPIASGRPFLANNMAPTLAPFATIAAKTLPTNALPPVWSRVVQSDSTQMDPVASKQDELGPEEVESPIERKSELKELADSSVEDEIAQPPPTPMPPRKTSNGASRLLQFQQLVPSNQARTSLVAP